MSTENEQHRVLFVKDGQETLTDSEPYDAARKTARRLDHEGYTVVATLTVDEARKHMRLVHVESLEQGPETYRGLTVPKSLRVDSVHAKERYGDWKRGVDAAMDLMRPMVETLHNDTPCALDHHGYCQEHGLPGMAPCPDGEARKLLKATEEAAG
jgi:hypothetical protein